MPLPISSEEKARLRYQIFSIFVQNGVDGISMDEAARRIKISKATLYKYCKRKEDIVQDMVGEMSSHLNALQFIVSEGITGVLESLSMLYRKGVFIASYSSLKFIADLKSKYPDMYDVFRKNLEEIEMRFLAFYDQAVRVGYCNSVSVDLVIKQVKMMLPVMIRADYLKEHHTTVSAVITDYYKLLLHQVLNVEYVHLIQQENTYSFVSEVSETLSKYMYVKE